MSLTNTDPIKTDRFPKFDWPRIDVPAITFPLDEHLADVEAAEERALAQARAAFERAPARHRLLHRRADPGRGRRQPHAARVPAGDAARCATSTTRCSSSTRCRPASGPPAPRGPTSSSASQPDIVAFAKKVQVGGIMAGRRVDEVADNVFRRVAAGSTPPGAAGWSTWCARAGSWRSSSPTA